MRYFNWKLAIVLVVATGIFGVAAFSLHRWQKSTKAERALPRGQKAYELKKWDEAADQLGRYLVVNNQDVEVLIKYAEAQVNRRPLTAGNAQQAIAAYRTALRLKSDEVEAAKQLVGLYLSFPSPQAGDARLTAERCLKDRDDPDLRRMLAHALWELREFDKAVAELKKVIAEHPENIAAYESMAARESIRAQATGMSADEWLDEAVRKNPDSALAYAVRAHGHLVRNRKDEALADLARALEHDLSDTSVRLRVAEELIYVEKWDKAREQLQALRAASPGELRLWGLWKELAVRTGSLGEMQMVAEEGMKALGAEAWDFMPIATRLLIISGHLENVETYLSQMRNKDINPPEVAYLDGLLAEKQERFEDAVKHWQQAVALAANARELNPEPYIALADALRRQGDPESAIRHLQVLLSKRPEVVQAQFFLARLYAQTGKWEPLLDQARQVQQMPQASPQVRAEASLLALEAWLRVRGRKADAKAWANFEVGLGQLDKATNGALAVKLLQVRAAMTREKSTEAQALLEELNDKYPSQPQVMLLRAGVYVSRGDDAKAQELYREMIAKFPQASEPALALAALLNRQGGRAECESTLKEAFARIEEPQARVALGLTLAGYYFQWQEKQKRFEWLTDLAAQFPGDVRCRHQLLTCEQVLQDVAAAQKIIETIKDIEEGGQELQGVKGTQWRYEQARWWLLADRFKNDHPELDFKKTYPQIVKLLQENLLTNPEDDPGQPNRLLLAEAYKKAEQPQLILSTYRDAYKHDPNDIQVVVRTATALQNAGEFEEAQAILDKAGERGLSHPEMERLLVGSDVERGDLTSASATLQQLIERDPNDFGLQLTYARVLILRQQFAEAEEILSDLRARLPDSVLVARTQFQFYLRQGDTDKAVRLCNEFVDKTNNASAYLLRADLYIMLQENDKALQDLGKAIAMEPQNPATWEARARVYAALERTGEAISDVRRALTLAPGERRIQTLAVSLFIVSEQRSLWDEAEQMIDRALADQASSQGKGDPALALLKARILILRGTGPTITKARELLRQITTDYPKFVDAWQLYAQLEIQKEEPGRALDVATRGLAHNEKNKQLLLLKAHAEKMLSPSVAAMTTLPALAEEYPDDVEIVIQWADAYARAERPDKAVELLEQKLPRFEGTARRRGEIALAAAMYSAQQRERAKALFETLITADPQDPTPVMTLGQLLRKEKRWTEVNQLLNLWRTTNPKDAETATNMARILAGSGDKQALQMAEDQLRMILEPNPESVPTLVLLGMLMQDAGRNAEASRLDRRILELDPNNIIAINNLAWMLCEEPNPSPVAITEALALANHGLEIMPEYMDLLDTRGVVYYQAGALEKAEADFVKSISLFPTNAPQSAGPQFHLARTYGGLNRRTQALEHLKLALNLNRRNVQLAKDHVAAGRFTHAIKVLKDAISLQEQMEQFKTNFDERDLVGVRSGDDWTEARLLLEQLQTGR